MAVAADASAEAKPAARKKSGYELQTLTGWLLRQEQKGETGALYKRSDLLTSQ